MVEVDFTEVIRPDKRNFFSLIKRYTKDNLFLRKVKEILEETGEVRTEKITKLKSDADITQEEYEVLKKMKEGLEIGDFDAGGEFLDKFNDETTTDGRELVLTDKGEELLENSVETLLKKEEVEGIESPVCMVCGERISISVEEKTTPEFLKKMGVDLKHDGGEELKDIDAFAIVDSRDEEGEELFKFKRNYNGYGFVCSSDCFKKLVKELEAPSEEEEEEEEEVGFESFG